MRADIAVFEKILKDLNFVQSDYLKLTKRSQKESNREIRKSYRAAKKKLKEGYHLHTEYTALRFQRSYKIIKVLSRVQESLQNNRDDQASAECEDSAAWLKEFLFGASGWPEECKKILKNSSTNKFIADEVCLGGFFEDDTDSKKHDDSREEKKDMNKVHPQIADATTQTGPSPPPGFEFSVNKSDAVENPCKIPMPSDESKNKSPKSRISAPPGFEKKEVPNEMSVTSPLHTSSLHTPSRPPPGFKEQESSQKTTNTPFTTPPFLRKYTREQLLHLCKTEDNEYPPGFLTNYTNSVFVPFIPNPPGFPINHPTPMPFTPPLLSAEAIPFQPYAQLPRSPAPTDFHLGQSGMYNKGSTKADFETKRRFKNHENLLKEEDSSDKPSSELMPQRRRRRPGLENKNDAKNIEKKPSNFLEKTSSQIDPLTELWDQLDKNDDTKRTFTKSEYGLERLLTIDKENWECSSQNATDKRDDETVSSFHSLAYEDITCDVVEESNLNPSANEFKI